MDREKEYEASIFDPARVRRYAVKVARQANGNIATVQYGGTSGWFLGVIIEEGARDSQHGSWEGGNVFFLRDNGELMIAHFHTAMQYYDDSADPLSSHLDFRAMSDHELLYMDRPSLGRYRHVQHYSSKDRQEFKPNFRITVHAKGVGISRAIKRINNDAGSAQYAANWYQDPNDASLQRYWDGNRWTGHTAPR